MVFTPGLHSHLDYDLLCARQVLASKKGAMRALGRLARHDAAAVEIASNAGLPPLVALLDCEDASLVRRCAVVSCHLVFPPPPPPLLLSL